MLPFIRVWMTMECTNILRIMKLEKYTKIIIVIIKFFIGYYRRSYMYFAIEI